MKHVALSNRTRLSVELLESRALPALVATMVADIAAGPASSEASPLASLKGRLLLSASDGVHGKELWISDGTAIGTQMVKDICPGSVGGLNTVRGITVLNDVGYFWATDGVHGNELWRTDGTAAGTYMVKDINPGGGSSNPAGQEYIPGLARSLFMSRLDDVLYFTADDGVHGSELWRTDGTAQGTWLVADIGLDSLGNSVLWMTPIGSHLYFRGPGGLWKSDGTAFGTELIFHPTTPPGQLSLIRIGIVNSTLIFWCNQGEGLQLWRSDGTTPGTSLLAAVLPPFTTALQPFPTVADASGGGQVAFPMAQENSGVWRLWKTDGTPSGTVQPAPGLSWPLALVGTDPVAIGNKIVFMADDGVNGPELWGSDGTASGTLMLTNNPGLAGSISNNNPVVEFANNRIFFRGIDAVHGRELWTSDGTVAGTFMVQDINPGPGNSSAISFQEVNDIIFFQTTDGVHGNELWRLDEVPDVPAVAGTRINEGSQQRSRVTDLTVTFNMEVTFADGNPANAFTFIRDGGKPVQFAANSKVVNGVTVVTLSNFTGISTQFGSLADGRYTLTALASQITANGQQMTSNYTFGEAQGLFRMFGDINGDRRVDGADFVGFVSTYGLLPVNPAFIAAFDFNGDGRIDGADFGQFVLRYGQLLP